MARWLVLLLLIAAVTNSSAQQVAPTPTAHSPATYGLSVTGNSMQKISTDRNRDASASACRSSLDAATSLVKRGKMIRENMLCVIPWACPWALTGHHPYDITRYPRGAGNLSRMGCLGGSAGNAHQLMNEPGVAPGFDAANRFRCPVLRSIPFHSIPFHFHSGPFHGANSSVKNLIHNHVANAGGPAMI